MPYVDEDQLASALTHYYEAADSEDEETTEEDREIRESDPRFMAGFLLDLSSDCVFR